MDYNFREIEKKWQQRWVEQQTYRVTEDIIVFQQFDFNIFAFEIVLSASTAL
jgi:leucyl-tRNA synthetase